MLIEYYFKIKYIKNINNARVNIFNKKQNYKEIRELKKLF